jgi:TolB-like protein
MVLAVVLGFDFGGARLKLLGEPSAAKIRSIVVLPLENLSQDPEQEYFADGMTDALITNLAQISALKVISRTSAMRYKGTKKPLSEIARELHVDGVVEGSVMRGGGRVRISAQLIEAPRDRHLWAGSYERDLRDVLSMQDEVTRAIVSEIRVKVTPQEKVQLASARAVNPDTSQAQPSVTTLWPPDHKMHSASILGVTDPDGDPITIRIDRIRQDEPTDRVGDGDTCPDAQGVGTATAKLRAERSGAGNGRVYRIFFTATDGRGGSTPGVVKVSVSHDQGHSAVDDGPLFDSATCHP